MISRSPPAFTYPAPMAVRRHGPSGYASLESFRPWLRDEFSFRCDYCLIRECWGRFTGEFDLDHFLPQRQIESRHDYENLMYACHACNLKKGSQDLPAAGRVLNSKNVKVALDGRLIALTAQAERIIDVVALNSPLWVQWRLTWIRITELAAERNRELYCELMGFPTDLPDLSRLKPPANSRPEGVAESFFVKRERGELPVVFVA